MVRFWVVVKLINSRLISRVTYEVTFLLNHIQEMLS